MNASLIVDGTAVDRPLELSLEDLRTLDARWQVPDVGRLAEGRQGRAIHLAGIASLAGASDAAFVHVACEDDAFTANLTGEEARAGLILYELDGAPLPRRFGGPFRLLFPDGEDCSVNVKFLASIRFRTEPGPHTARCADD